MRKTPLFKAIHPWGKSPAYVLSDGQLSHSIRLMLDRIRSETSGKFHCSEFWAQARREGFGYDVFH